MIESPHAAAQPAPLAAQPAPVGGTPPREERSVVARYGVALLCVALALALTAAIQPAVPRLTWLPLLGAVAIAAWYGRLGAGLMTAILGSAGIVWLYVEPARRFRSIDAIDLIWLFSFLAIAGLLSVLIDALHRERAVVARSAERHRLVADELETVAGELHRSEARLAGIVGSVTDAIVAVDDAGAIVLFNTGAERIFGIPAAEAMGTPLGRFLPGLVLPGHLGNESDGTAPRSLARSAGNRETGRLTPALATRADGTEFPIEASVAQVAFDSERIHTFVLRDITERRALEAQLLQAQKMEGIGQLAGGVAHDFNNILTVIKSYAEFLRAGLEDRDELRADADEVIAATDRAVGLTRQLLAFSRRQSLEPRLLDPSVVVRGMETMLRRLLGEEIELVVPMVISAGLVRVDPGQLEQVLVNLVVNARDALPYGGLITIETVDVTLTADDVRRHATQSATSQPEEPGDYVALRVSDSGVGMDPITQAHIFEPFFTTKPAGQGTGLGLATIYGIVRQSGGHIRVRSAVQRGTTFEIHLPRHASTDTDTVEIASLTLPRGGSETVLLVEDEIMVRRSIRRLLERAGYRVLEARHGGDALLVWRETGGAIDLLLTDMRMPQLGGPGLIDAIHRIRPELPVLLISGYAADAADAASPSYDPVGAISRAVFIEKPFTAEALLRGVREALDRSRPGLVSARGKPT